MLNYDILLEQVQNNGFIARVLALPDMVITADSREEVVALATRRIQDRLSKGDIVTVQIEAERHPWLKFAGTWEGDAGISEFKEAIAEYRHEIDSETDLADIP
jgi:hypothetical protein